MRPIEYKDQNKREAWGVQTPLGWPLSGSLEQQQVRIRKAQSHFCSAEEQPANEVEKVKQWWAPESYGSSKSVESLSGERRRAQHFLEPTTKFEDGSCDVELLWTDDKVKLPNNYGNVLEQLRLLQRRLGKDKELKKKYSGTIKADLEKVSSRKCLIMIL